VTKLRARCRTAATILWALFGFLCLPVASATVTTLSDAESPAMPPSAAVAVRDLTPPANAILRAPREQSVRRADAGSRTRAEASGLLPRQRLTHAALTGSPSEQLSVPISASSRTSGAADEPSKPKTATALLMAVGLLGLLYNCGRRLF
jgi:hypothetical protein